MKYRYRTADRGSVSQDSVVITGQDEKRYFMAVRIITNAYILKISPILVYRIVITPPSIVYKLRL